MVFRHHEGHLRRPPEGFNLREEGIPERNRIGRGFNDGGILLPRLFGFELFFNDRFFGGGFFDGLDDLFPLFLRAFPGGFFGHGGRLRRFVPHDPYGERHSQGRTDFVHQGLFEELFFIGDGESRLLQDQLRDLQRQCVESQ